MGITATAASLICYPPAPEEETSTGQTAESNVVSGEAQGETQEESNEEQPYEDGEVWEEETFEEDTGWEDGEEDQ